MTLFLLAYADVKYGCAPICLERKKLIHLCAGVKIGIDLLRELFSLVIFMLHPKLISCEFAVSF
jgi:hypothetical protein